MSLDNFRNRTIIWDTVNKDFPQPIQIMQGDVNARTLLIKIVDNGTEIDLTGHSLKLTYQYTNSSNSGFVMIPPKDLAKGEFILVIPTEMTATGVIEANLILLNKDKEQVIVSKNLTFISDNSTVSDLAQEVNNKIDDFTKLLLANMPQVMRSELNDLHAQTESNKSNIELKANLADMTSLQSAMTELKKEVEAFGISPENLVTIKSLLDAIARNASESEVVELINSVKVLTSNISLMSNGDYSPKANQTDLDNLQTAVTSQGIAISKIDSKEVAVDKLEDLAGLNMYPFHRKAIIQSNKSNAMAVLEAIKDIKLYGANPNLKYRISELYRNRHSASHNNWTWWVGIRDNNNLEACRFMVVVTTSDGYIEPTGMTKLTFTTRNDSGITGEVWIDWSKLPDNIAWATTYDELGLDEKTYLGVTEQHSVDLSDVTPRVIEDKVNNTHLIRQHYLENLSVSVPKINNLIDVNTLTFSVLTDIHNTDSVAIRSSAEIFGVITEYCDHDFLANLGDLIPGNFDKPKSLRQANDVMQLVNQHAKCPHYVIRGNHDVNDYELALVPTEDEKVSRFITNKEWYQVTTKKSEKYGIVQDPDNIYAGYYYVDNQKQKIRSIFLNTSETKDGLMSSSDYTWWGVQSEKQLKWFANVALNLQGKADWAVMIFSHIPPFSNEFIHNHGVNRIAVREISESFLHGSSGNAPTSNPSFPRVSFDFSEQGPRELIGHFVGHVHDDYYEKINGVNYFISTSGTPYQKYDTAPPRSQNGLDTLSMNTMVVNREKRQVDVIKTGSGKDWSFTW